MNKIVEILNKYSSIDFLEKFSALNLIFTNQNKAFVLDYGINETLNNYNSCKTCIKADKFVDLIQRLENKPELFTMIDPAEESFFNRAYLEKEYHMFSGINGDQIYYLNRIIDLLVYGESNNFPLEFVNMSLTAIKAILTLSEMIYSQVIARTGNWLDNKKVKSNIVCPPNLDYFTKAIIFDKKYIFELFGSNLFEKYFLLDVDEYQYEYFEDKFPLFYKKPFIIEGDYVIILNPTCLAYCLNQFIFNLANEFHIKNQFDNKLIENTYVYILNNFGKYLQIDDYSNQFEILGMKANYLPFFKEYLFKYADSMFLRFVFISEDSFDENKNDLELISTNKISDLYYKHDKEFAMKGISQNKILML